MSIRPEVKGQAMLGKLALPAIRELIEARDDDTLREVVNRWHSADLAELVDAVPSGEQVHVLRLVESKLAGETFEYLDLTPRRAFSNCSRGRVGES